jgi:hypothetical protein
MEEPFTHKMIMIYFCTHQRWNNIRRVDCRHVYYVRAALNGGKSLSCCSAAFVADVDIG